MLKFKTIGVDSQLALVTLDIPPESLQEKNLTIAENSLRDQILKGKEDRSLGLVITMGIKLGIQHQLIQRVVLIQHQY